jgi:hypothetical protein
MHFIALPHCAMAAHELYSHGGGREGGGVGGGVGGVGGGVPVGGAVIANGVGGGVGRTGTEPAMLPFATLQSIELPAPLPAVVYSLSHDVQGVVGKMEGAAWYLPLAQIVHVMSAVVPLAEYPRPQPSLQSLASS